MKSFSNALAVSVVTLSIAAFAQGTPKDKAAPQAKEKAPPSAAPAMPPAPTMTPEGRKFIDAMVGSWSFNDVVLKMGDHEMKGTMTMKCEKAALGWVAECKGVQDMGKGMPKVEGIYLMAWDVVTGMGHVLEVESGGNVHDHKGKWNDDKSITLAHTGKNLEGKEETDTVTFTFTAPNQMAFKADGKSGTTTNWTFTGTGKK